MSTLSDRQRKILQFIITFVSENEFPPTIREIGERVGISSTSVVNYNLAKLEELALISRRKEVSRGLSLNWDRILEMNLAPDGGAVRTRTGSSSPDRTNGLHFDTSLLRVPILGAIAAGEPIQVEARDASNPEDLGGIARRTPGCARLSLCASRQRRFNDRC